MKIRTVAVFITLTIALICYYIDIGTNIDGMHLFWTLGAFFALVGWFKSVISDYVMQKMMLRMIEEDPELKKQYERFK